MWDRVEAASLEAEARELADLFRDFLVRAASVGQISHGPRHDVGLADPVPGSARPDEGPLLLTVREVSERLRLAKSTVYRLISSGEIEHLRAGGADGAIRVTEAALERYIQQQTRGGIPDDVWADVREELLDA